MAQSAKNALMKTTISAAFVTVAGMTEWHGPGSTAEKQEDKTVDGATAIDEIPTGYTKQKPFTAKLNLEPAGTTHKFIINSVKSPVTAGVANKIVFPDGTTEHAWTGFWSDYMPHGVAGQLLTMDVENTPRGAITVPS